MPISDDTYRKMQAILDKAAELVKRVPSLTRTEAVMCVSAHMTLDQIEALKVRADHIEERQDQQIQAETRAKAAYAATFRSNVESVPKK